MAITINNIAKKAGVSKRTVSRVLNKSPFVNEKTRKKVEEIMRKEDYRANVFARTLAIGAGFNFIGIITGVEDLFNKPYYTKIIQSIERYLSEHHHAALIINLLDNNLVNDPEKKFDMVQNFYTSKIIKAFAVLGPVVKDERIEYLSKNGARGIVVGSKSDAEGFGYVDSDNEQGVASVLNYIIGHGHRKIAGVFGPNELTSARERKSAFLKVLKVKGIEIKEKYLALGDYTKESGKLVARKLLKQASPPSAIFASNDDMAIGVLEEAKALGFKVPGDISIAGFDGINQAYLVKPALTTVSHSYEDIGKAAADALVNGDFSAKIKLPVSLVKGNSVKEIRK